MPNRWRFQIQPQIEIAAIRISANSVAISTLFFSTDSEAILVAISLVLRDLKSPLFEIARDSDVRFGNLWETDFYTAPVLRAAVLTEINSAPAVYKIQGP